VAVDDQDGPRRQDRPRAPASVRSGRERPFTGNPAACSVGHSLMKAPIGAVWLPLESGRRPHRHPSRRIAFLKDQPISETHPVTRGEPTVTCTDLTRHPRDRHDKSQLHTCQGARYRHLPERPTSLRGAPCSAPRTAHGGQGAGTGRRPAPAARKPLPKRLRGAAPARRPARFRLAGDFPPRPIPAAVKSRTGEYDRPVTG
jgi:hypothetical protein